MSRDRPPGPPGRRPGAPRCQQPRQGTGTGAGTGARGGRAGLKLFRVKARAGAATPGTALPSGSSDSSALLQGAVARCSGVCGSAGVSARTDARFRGGLVASRAVAHVPSGGGAGLSGRASSAAACFLLGPPRPFPSEPVFPGVSMQTALQVVFLAGKRVCGPPHDKCLFCDFGCKCTSWGAE